MPRKTLKEIVQEWLPCRSVVGPLAYRHPLITVSRSASADEIRDALPCLCELDLDLAVDIMLDPAVNKEKIPPSDLLPFFYGESDRALKEVIKCLPRMACQQPRQTGS